MREELKQHIADMLSDEAPVPKEIAIEAYTDALMGFFTTFAQTIREEERAIAGEYMPPEVGAEYLEAITPTTNHTGE